ncbi:hypothetical protein TYRP_002544 [Tyrophagus putrescentiae]|nr:hypothetical protein TYRP_002544 [Tyrophagus putrescentiae]
METAVDQQQQQPHPHHRQHLSTMVTTSAAEVIGHHYQCCGEGDNVGDGGEGSIGESPSDQDNHHHHHHHHPQQENLPTADTTTTTAEPAPIPSLSSQKRPVRQSLWEAVRRNPHSRCLALSLLIVACLSLTFWCQLEKVNSLLIALRIMDSKLFDLEGGGGSSSRSSTNTEEEGSSAQGGTCDDGLLFLPLVALVSLYLGYLVECWHSTTRLVLMYRVPCDSVYSVVEQMRQAQPIIWWKAACFHHIRHTRPISRYRSGSSTSSGSGGGGGGGPVFQERVTTHVSGSYFSYSSCGVRDISKTLAGLERFPTTRVYLSKEIAAAAARSKLNLLALPLQMNALLRSLTSSGRPSFRANERYDHYLEIREGLDLVGVNWQEVMIATGGKGGGSDGDSTSSSSVNPWYNNQLTYWLFSVVLLSWPLRVLLEYNTAYVHYQIVKLFGVNYNGGEANGSCGQQQLQPNPLSRVSTMDTLSNCLIAPSYSEAMLAEQQHQQQQLYLAGQTGLQPEGVTVAAAGARDDDEEDVVDLEKATSTKLLATSGRIRSIANSALPYSASQPGSSSMVKDAQQLTGEEEPPSYDEVFAYQQQHFVQPRDTEVIIANSPRDSSSSSSFSFSHRPSLKSYWHHLLGLILGGQQQQSQSTHAHHHHHIPRSITDKDFFQKLLAAQQLPYSGGHRVGKPPSSSLPFCRTSFSNGDISHNLVAHV